MLPKAAQLAATSEGLGEAGKYSYRVVEESARLRKESKEEHAYKATKTVDNDSRDAFFSKLSKRFVERVVEAH